MNVKMLLVLGIISFLLFPASQSASFEPETTIDELTSTNSIYHGNLRIYITEIESRWTMENGEPYEYAFLDYAFNDNIEIAFQETYHDSLSWQGDITEENVMIIATLFNGESHRNYADPPLGSPFDAYYVDAAAGVLPGEIESNTHTNDFTHTVFCEVGTATWCHNCPGMAETLHTIFTTKDYPFYYVEMVNDVENQRATERMDDEYNIRYFPTGFYDGGYDIAIGGGMSVAEHSALIEEMGTRSVHNLDFTIQAIWTGEGTINIIIDITNNEENPNNAPEMPTMDGPIEGKTGTPIDYTITTTDPDGDTVFFKIDWGDGLVSDWLGPYYSGAVADISHTWSERGSYIIKAKAKDNDGAETDWAWCQVTVPKTKTPFTNIFQWFAKYFPILEQLIRSGFIV